MNKIRLNGFWLKIIAIITMTLDHVAVAFIDYMSSDIFSTLKIIGRLSFPLFAFLIAEGMVHTKSKEKYLARLGGSALFISLALYVLLKWGDLYFPGGNIFITLFMGALIIYCLNLKDYQKLLAIPVFVICYFLQLTSNPTYILMSYDLFGLLLIVGFYLSFKVAAKVATGIESAFNLADGTLKAEIYMQRLKNILSAGVLLALMLIYYFVYKSFDSLIDSLNVSIQAYCIIAGAFLLFYDGTRGYNKNWFKTMSYLYYPLHLVIIFGIYLLI